MCELCRVINKNIASRRKGGFTLTVQQNRRVCTLLMYLRISEFPSMMIYVRFSVLKIVLLKQNFRGKDHFIHTDYTHLFSSHNCIFFYASFVEKSRVGNTNVPLLHFFERKTSHKHIHQYNIKQFQYILVNTSFWSSVS